jgi:hypothetical protein
MKLVVNPLLFGEKPKPSSKYEVKVWSLHQNTKLKKSSSKYKVSCEAYIFLKRKWSLRQNTESKCEAFVKIQSQRNLRQNMKLVVKPLFFKEKM